MDQDFFSDLRAIRSCKADPETKHLLLVLMTYCRQDSCYPSLKTIANDLGTKERATQLRIAEAVKSGWVKVAKQEGPNRVNRYVLNVQRAIDEGAADCAKEDEKAQPTAPKRAQPTAPKGAAGYTQRAQPTAPQLPSELPVEQKHKSATAKPAARFPAGTMHPGKAPAKPKDEPTEAQAKARWWSDEFCERWEQTYSATYMFTARDGKAMHGILDSIRHDRTTWTRMLSNYFADRDSYMIRNNGHSMPDLARRFSTYLVGTSDEIAWRGYEDLDPATRAIVDATDRERAAEYARMTPEQLKAAGITFVPNAKPQESAA